MAVKIVMQMNINTARAGPAPSLNYAGGQHAAGWTETMWDDSGNSMAILQARLRDVVFPFRAQLLAETAQLVGARLYVAGGGKGILVPGGMFGSFNYTSDQVNVSLLLSSNNDAALVQRRWWLRGLPDEQVTGGEFVPTPGFRPALESYLDEIRNYYWRGLNATAIQGIIEVSDAGLVSAAGPLAWAANSRVTIARTSGVNGRVGGTYTVQAVGPLANQVLLNGWDQGKTRGGTGYIKGTPTLYQLGANGKVTVVRATTHRTGRPTGLYSGRQRRRRRK